MRLFRKITYGEFSEFVQEKKSTYNLHNYFFILGGEGVFYLSIYAFMADITTPENRAFRYGMLQLAISMAAPLSPIVGSYIYSNVPYQYRYIGVFLAALIGTIVGGTYLLLRIRSYDWKPQKKEVIIHG